jgi:hypothetical protein
MEYVIDRYEYDEDTGQYNPVYAYKDTDTYTAPVEAGPATNLNDPSFWERYGLTPAELNRANGQTPGVGSSTPSNFLDTITNILSGKSGQGAQLAGTLGLTALLNATGNNGQQGVYKGYQGGIPNYTASRTQTPIPATAGYDYPKSSDPYQQAALIAAQKGVNANLLPTQIAANANKQYGSFLTPENVSSFIANNKITPQRRPGEGGITYFSPIQYHYNAPAPTPTVTPMAAGGGISTLGGYSDGGRLLRGPGDGVSDSIPATIGDKQPARLADGEFVIPARIVSEIGNGSSEAGARKLYAMMDRVQGARKKSLKNVAANTKADKYLPT